MEQFKIRQDGFKEIRQAALIKAIPFLVIVISGAFAIYYFNPNSQQSNLNGFLIMIPITFCALAFGVYRGLNRQKEIFNSYRLTLDHNGITRERKNTSTITIANSDLSAIIKNSNGSFIIKGNSTENIIGVPSQIEDYEKLEKLLFELKEISTKTSKPLLQKFQGLLTIMTMALMVAVYTSQDKIIVGVSGTVLLIILGYSIFYIQRSKHIDIKTKKGMRWLVIVILSIIYSMYFELIVR